MARRDLEDGEVMRLGLSSAAAPDAELDELVGACVRRGLAGLELRACDAHGVDMERNALERAAAVASAAAAGITITGYRVHRSDDPMRLARMAAALGVPIILDGDGDADADGDGYGYGYGYGYGDNGMTTGDVGHNRIRPRQFERAMRLREAGADVVVVVRGATAVRDAPGVVAAGLGLAWDAHPDHGALGEQAEAILRDFPGALRHIRLIGGGPEVAMQDGKGIGALMGRLALSGFDGNLVLAPSSSRYRVAWQSWLGRRGGWGCGSKAAEPGVVAIAGETSAAGVGR